MHLAAQIHAEGRGRGETLIRRMGGPTLIISASYEPRHLTLGGQIRRDDPRRVTPTCSFRRATFPNPALWRLKSDTGTTTGLFSNRGLARLGRAA